MPKKKTTLPKNFCELCQAGDITALQAIYADTDINATERGGAKFHRLALDETPPAFMQWLLDHGADVQFRRSKDDSPPLYHQVQAGNAEHAAVLLQNGANANYRNEYGNSILHFAETPALINLLLAYGANPAAINKRGQTPFDSLLDHAPFAKQSEIPYRASLKSAQRQPETNKINFNEAKQYLKTFQAAYHHQGSLKIISRERLSLFSSGRSRFHLLQLGFTSGLAVAIVLHAHRAGGNNGRNRVFVHHLRNRRVAQQHNILVKRFHLPLQFNTVYQINGNGNVFAA